MKLLPECYKKFGDLPDDFDSFKIAGNGLIKKYDFELFFHSAYFSVSIQIQTIKMNYMEAFKFDNIKGNSFYSRSFHCSKSHDF